MRPQKGKQKLFDAAIKLFESQGYFATTVEQITVEAGVSKGLVYNYFKSKEELLVGLIEKTSDRMASVAETHESIKSIEKSLAIIIDKYLNYLQNERRFLKLQLILILMPELKEVVNKPLLHRTKLLLRKLTDLFIKADIIKSKNKARLFLAMLDGIALHYLFIYDRYPLASMRSQLIQAANDLCHRPAPRSKHDTNKEA